MNLSRHLVWLRRDLRLHDHRALREAGKGQAQVTVVFVFDTGILKKLKDKDDRRVTFIFESLREIDAELREKGSQLVILHGDPVKEIPHLATTLGVDAVFTHRDYETAAKKRDQKVKSLLFEGGIAFHTLKDQVIFEGTEVSKPDGKPYTVFTPYSKRWLSRLTEGDTENQKVTSVSFTPRKILSSLGIPLDLENVGFQWSDPGVPTGASGARKLLKSFEKDLPFYEERRNFPSLDHGTSHLSVHFRFGTLSIREAVRLAQKSDSKGAKTWLSELIWRDFFQMILDQFPHVEKGAFRKEYDSIPWPGKKEHLTAWQEGRTGYPLVDAAMIQLKTTGWMHNRLRMVVASFLTKDLLMDWRRGEEWFARYLLDFDLAANNGGWQWSASTGCDAQPYFRIFNPISQSEKFDPKGIFIRSQIPELKSLSEKKIHFPSDFDRPKNYPAPIVQHDKQRGLALQLYKKAKK